MTRHPHMILHIGAPKCGSSALQTALSLTPDLRSADGQDYRYRATTLRAGRWWVLEGNTLIEGARMSPYGYASWSHLGPRVDRKAIFAAMHQVMAKGRRRGHIPILSNEGWINHAPAFAAALAEWGNPPVDVVAFLRPPVDWMNAAFWQWGVWHQPDLDKWMARSNMPYSFAEDLEAWAAIPNLRLTVRSQKPDVVAKFAGLYDLPLEAKFQSNVTSPAILTGFLLRNRIFRPTGHEGSVEFLVQRWCPPMPGRKLWAVLPRHVEALRPVRLKAIEILGRILSPEDREDLFADPRWTREMPYHEDILEGISWLNDPDLFAPLYHSLHAGVTAAARAAGRPIPALPPCPSEDADITAWDGAICIMLERLQEMDAHVRQNTVPAWKRAILTRLPRIGKADR